MRHRVRRAAEAITLAALPIITLAGACWAGPPRPPLMDVVVTPRVPLGGMEVSLITAAGIAAYGMWKSRK